MGKGEAFALGKRAPLPFPPYPLPLFPSSPCSSACAHRADLGESHDGRRVDRDDPVATPAGRRALRVDQL